MTESSKMDMSKTESKRILRSLELKAYRNVVDALRAQGSLNKSKQEVLKNLATALKVGEERCRSEIRRAINDDLLNSIAQSTNGKTIENGWRIESVKKIPSTPMFAAQTVFTALADNISDLVSSENERLSESKKSLHDILESQEQTTEANASRYHNSNLLGSLLANKTFRYDSVMSVMEKIVAYNCSGRKTSTHSKDANPMPVEPKKTVQWHDEICTSTASLSEAEINEDQHRNRGSTKNTNRHIRKSISKVTRVNKSKKNNENEFRDSRNKIDSKKNEVSDPIKDFVNQLVNRGKMNLEARSITPLNTYVNNNFKSFRNQESVQSDLVKKRSKPKSKPWNQKRLSAVARNRPLNSIQRTKTKTDTSTSNKNARRRKGDVTKSMEDDFMDVDSVVTAQELPKDTHKKKEIVKQNEKGMDSTAMNIKRGENASDNSSISDNFRIEIGRTSLEDDMKPHTFNLIPASRRLKLLQKRAQLGNDESAAPVKKLCSSSKNLDNRFSGASLLSSSAENSNSSTMVAENVKKVNNLTESIFSHNSTCRSSNILPKIDSKKEKLSLLGNIKVRNLNELSRDLPKMKTDQGKAAVINSTFLGMGEVSSDSVSDNESSVNKDQGFRGFTSTNGFNDFVPSILDSSSEASVTMSDPEEDGSNSSNSSEEDVVNGSDSKNEIMEIPVTQPFQIDEQLIDIESADVIIEDLEEHLSDEEDETQLGTKTEDSQTVSETDLETDSNVISEKKTYFITAENVSNSESEKKSSSDTTFGNSKNVYIIKKARPVSELWNSLKTYPTSETENSNSSSSIVVTLNSKAVPSTCGMKDQLPWAAKNVSSVVGNSRRVQIFGKVSSDTSKNLASANFIRKIALDGNNKASKLLLFTKKDTLNRSKNNLTYDKYFKLNEKSLRLSDVAASPSTSSRISPLLRSVTLKSNNAVSDEETKLKLDSSTSISTAVQSENKTNSLNHKDLRIREHFNELVHKLRWTKKEFATPEKRENALSNSIKVTNKPIRLLNSTTPGKIVVLTKSPRQISSRPSLVTCDEKTKLDSDSVICKVKNLSSQCSSSSYEGREISIISDAGETDNIIEVERPVVLSKENINVESDIPDESEKMEIRTDSTNKVCESKESLQNVELPTTILTTSTTAITKKLQFELPVQKMIQVYPTSGEVESNAESDSTTDAVEKNEPTKEDQWIEISSCIPNSEYQIADSISISGIDDELNEGGS